VFVPDFTLPELQRPAARVRQGNLVFETRAKRLADYLLDGHKALEAFLPTSIFLATDHVRHRSSRGAYIVKPCASVQGVA